MLSHDYTGSSSCFSVLAFHDRSCRTGRCDRVGRLFVRDLSCPTSELACECDIYPVKNASEHVLWVHEGCSLGNGDRRGISRPCTSDEKSSFAVLVAPSAHLELTAAGCAALKRRCMKRHHRRSALDADIRRYEMFPQNLRCASAAVVRE